MHSNSGQPHQERESSCKWLLPMYERSLVLKSYSFMVSVCSLTMVFGSEYFGFGIDSLLDM